MENDEDEKRRRWKETKVRMKSRWVERKERKKRKPWDESRRKYKDWS
jgi:hypothetical protein